MTDDTTGNATPREKVVRTTFCVRFNGDEKERVMAFAKAEGKSANQFIRTLVLEKCSLNPSR